MKKRFLVGVALLFSSGISFAQCVGSGSLYSCFDGNGNSYLVNKIGNTTYVTGSNGAENWNQSSTTTGRTTYQYGTSADGGDWNQIIQNNGNGTTTRSGVDSDGNSFYKVCNKFGCN